jgi:hypothetical protein
MRRRDPLTPAARRELDALDRALAGEPVDDALHELEALVRDVRASAPQMRPDFAERLERELAGGFAGAAPAAPPARRRRRPRRTLMLSTAGTVAAALAALVVVLGQGSQQEPSQLARPETPQAPSGARERGGGQAVGAQADRATADPATSAAPPMAGGAIAPQPPASVAPGAPRRVERSADLVLETPASRLRRTADDVVRTVDRFGGIVASSTTAADDRGGDATFDLRIPAARLDDALAALSRLGHVAERRQSLQDITASLGSLRDRLADARAERRTLLRALGRATTRAQIDSLRARLRITRSTISRLNGDLASLRRRAELARVAVTVRGVERETGGGGWSPRDALGDAARILEVMAGVAVVALAVAVPLGLLGAALAFGARGLRRRGRERALDPA